ncbi:MAG: ATP-binding protein [Myxococcales bacterium]|nr:ATP-binding protein [Myxococcales bacterium]
MTDDEAEIPPIVSWLEQASRLVGERPAGRRFAEWADTLARPVAARHRVVLRDPTPPQPPPTPYPPVLGAYRDPRLFAGREAEVAELARVIEQVPVTCVFATSGAGKSSLLRAGLLAKLYDARVPAALCDRPCEGSAPGLLVAGLLEPPPPVATPQRFAAALAIVWHHMRRPAVLVIDQFEELFEGPHASAARARLGPYLAAAMAPAPDGRELCRWVLAYRHEFHGVVEQWLGDVLADARADARAAEKPEVDTLPFDLIGHGRQREWPLRVFGAPPRGGRVGEGAYEAFHAAITAPLAHRCGGRSYSIDPDDAARLARAFADARAAQPDRPLVPELQVVLGRLVDEADGGRLQVPAKVDAWIDDALRDHVERSIARAVPVGPRPVERERALVLAALHRLVDSEHRTTRRLPIEAFEAIIDAGGDRARAGQIVARLSHGPTRLLVIEATEAEGRCCALGHDRLAEVVDALVRERGARSFDPELLDLIDFVHRRAALHRDGDKAALGHDDEAYDALKEASELLWDDARRAWFGAWRVQMERLRRAAAGRGRGAAAVVGAVRVAGRGDPRGAARCHRLAAGRARGAAVGADSGARDRRQRRVAERARVARWHR